jgi:hypothetical protein
MASSKSNHLPYRARKQPHSVVHVGNTLANWCAWCFAKPAHLPLLLRQLPTQSLLHKQLILCNTPRIWQVLSQLHCYWALIW